MAVSPHFLTLRLILVAVLILLSISFHTAKAEGSLQTDILCLSSPYDATQSEAQKSIRGLLDVIEAQFAAYPTIGEAFVALAPILCIDSSAATARGYLETDSNLIALSHRLSFDEMLAILLHELRHLDQFNHGYCPSSNVSMQENARAIMATEADAAAIASLIAFTMREEGNPGPWQAMLSWPNYSDIPERFEEIMEQTDDALTATAAAFTQWYLSDWRTEAYYLSSCSDYLDQLDRTKALPRYDLLPEDFLDRLCRLPTGEAYDCDFR